jgi:hypothetical protein
MELGSECNWDSSIEDTSLWVIASSHLLSSGVTFKLTSSESEVVLMSTLEVPWVVVSDILTKTGSAQYISVLVFGRLPVWQPTLA